MERRSGTPRTVVSRSVVSRAQEVAPSRGGLGEDRANVCILLFLYVLQGIPLGLAGSIPMILQNHNVGYKEQAVFSLVNWPFSLKLLWAPLVDSIFSRRFGRRKSWLVPTQYLIGLSMLLLASRVSALLGEDNGHPDVSTLTALFFAINFLAATQDIAVDGWALTMLSRRNVSYASTCNSVGQTAGYFLGNVVFLALESAAFCNKYLRIVPQDEGIVTLAGFLRFWGVVFFVTTTLVMFLKGECEEGEQAASPESGIRDTYLKLYRILRLRNMWLMLTFLLTCKVAFAAADAVTGLKLVEAGVRKETLALFALPMVPVQVLLPFALSRYTAGPRPLALFLGAYPFRLVFGLVFPVLVWWTHQLKTESGEFPIHYYIVILAAYMLQQVTVYGMFVSLMAFFAVVSDPAIGGTYMTLLNTICNLGGNWPSTAALWAVDALTSRSCSLPLLGDCSTRELQQKCSEGSGQCVITTDGYYVEAVACAFFGLLWLRWGRSAIRRLQNLPASAWRCPRGPEDRRTE